MREWIPFVLVICCLWLGISAHAAQEPQRLEPGKPVEREIAGGESHTYQLTLQVGQFARFRLTQRAIDSTLILIAPDSRQLVEMNLTRAGSEESLSLEVATAGLYRLTVRGEGATTRRGAYRLESLVKASATGEDKKRLRAETLMLEAKELAKQEGKTAQQMIETLQQALPIWRELGERSLVANSLFRIGLAHRDLNEYQKAVEVFEQALPIYQAAKDRAGEGGTLYQIGASYGGLGRLEKAVEYIEQALSISRDLKTRESEGVAIGGLAALYLRMGRYEKSIEYCELALQIYREVNDRRNEGLMLNNLAVAYSNLGRYEKAVQYVEQSLAISLETKNRAREAQALISLGVSYHQLGHREKAVEYYERALPIAREVKNRFMEMTAVNNIGYVYVELKKYDKAIEYLEKALALTREMKARDLEAEPLDSLGEAYRLHGQYEKATRYHEQVFAISRETKVRRLEVSSLVGLMLDWKARKRQRLGIYFGKQAVNLIQEMRGEFASLDRESQQSFLKINESTYRNLADLLISQGRLPEAEQVIRMLKEEEYFEFIRRDESSSPKAARAELTPDEQAIEKRNREISDHIAELGTERATLIDKKNRTAEQEQRLAKIDADLVVAGNAFQNFLSTLESEMSKSSEASARAYALRESQGLMEDLRELGKGVVALYTLVGEDRYRVILTTPDFQKGYEYPIKAADLNRKVLEFRESLQNPKLDPLPLARELYRILIGPVAKDLKAAGARTLMWSLDGVLRYVPVAALNDGKDYLIEQYQNVVFTPASQARLKDVPSRNWNALGLGVTKAHGERIPALPGVMEEMRGIIKEAGREQSGVLPGTIKLDEAFTQEAMLAGLRQRPQVVHVASHFQFSPGNETNSALLLGDGTFLSLAQIKSLPNVFGGVELLTLSACNTATGGSGANGKEVEGFGVLAQRQGAKAVAASLWPVADRSTKELMQNFYRLRETTSNTTKAEALRQAQLRLLRGEASTEIATAKVSMERQLTHEDDKAGAANKPRFTADPKRPYAHPYYWAPFILIGNWR
ncbi:MAG TPA: CHAT domain-containing protein [Blastocatellia bacterium]|nr:CHAT domain-containing protein [Blastocatellia bacterium]